MSSSEPSSPAPMPWQNLFHSADWMEILREGLGAEILELETGSEPPFPVPVFSKGPFRVLYPGFPVGDIPPGYCALFSSRELPGGKRGPTL